MSVLSKHAHSFKVKGSIKSNFWGLWVFWAILLIVSSSVVLLRAKRGQGGVLFADFILMCFPLLFNHNVLITVNTDTCILKCYYLTGWGSLRFKKIELRTAEGSYKAELGRGRRKYWQLVIYNRKGWFKTKVSVRDGRFSKSQLDTISLLIDECKIK